MGRILFFVVAETKESKFRAAISLLTVILLFFVFGTDLVPIPENIIALLLSIVMGLGIGWVLGEAFIHQEGLSKMS